MVHPSAVAENVFGTLGAVFWSVQLLPQIWKSWRRKDTAGLSTLMLFLWYVSGIWLGAYSYTSDLSIPLIIQPQLFTLFSTFAWAQCLHYDSKYSTLSSWVITVVALAVGGGVEAGLIVGCQHLQERGNERLNTATGVLAAIFVIAGLLPQYWEVWKFKAVVGISLIFLSIDLLGGVWSLLSLVFAPPPFDALAAVSYASVVALETGIFVLAAALNPGYYHRKRAAAAAGAKVEEAGPGGLDTRESTLTEVPGAVEEGKGKGGARLRPTDDDDDDEAVMREGGFGWLGEDEVERVRSRRAEEA
ncbi:hypothetical protein JCM3770_002310 [Rhodotorula araucariae]